MIRTSLIIVSRHRPAHLALCLAALPYQTHDDFEVVLVADPGSIGTCPDLPVRRIAFDQANIAAARNLGLGQASGEVVAFLDDDAIAEPFWLERISAPFANRRVLAAAGFTRGPDGMRWQARAERANPQGESYPIDIQTQSLMPVPAEGAISTLGTNCAFRRDALLAVAGFDPAFAYYLDETDVNLRMSACFPYMLTAIVPGAEVVHGLAPGQGRAGPRAPRDLTQIGRSAAILWRRQGVAPASEALIAAQRRRLLRMMVAGALDPFAVAPLLATLRQGLEEGARASLPPPETFADAPPAFLRFHGGARGGGQLIAGWHWQAARLRARAAAAVATGRAVTLILLTPTALPHRSRFTAGGWWEQSGGLWGAAGDQPGPPALRTGSFHARITHEAKRLAKIRPIN